MAEHPEFEPLVRAIRKILSSQSPLGACCRCGAHVPTVPTTIVLSRQDGTWIWSVQNPTPVEDILYLNLRTQIDPRFQKYQTKEGGLLPFLCLNCKELAVKYFVIEAKRESMKEGPHGPILL